MNPIYKFLSSLPTNGYVTAIGAIGLIIYGIGGLLTNNLDWQAGSTAILGGISALGLGNKLEKLKAFVATQQ